MKKAAFHNKQLYHTSSINHWNINDYKTFTKNGIKYNNRLQWYLTEMNRKWFAINANKDKNDNQIIQHHKYDNVHFDKCDLDFLINTNYKPKTDSYQYYFLVHELTNLIKQSRR